MFKVVINASPIISLCKIGLENIIFELFDEIYLTEEDDKEIYDEEVLEEKQVKSEQKKLF